MKKFMLLLLLGATAGSYAQLPKTELYDLIKKLIPDSTGYENPGDWAVGNPKKFPVKWKEDRLIMSEDTSINFYRLGNADITIKGQSFTPADKPLQWSIMLKGARSGYIAFSIVSAPPCPGMQPQFTIDSIFGKKPFVARLLKSCDPKIVSGYYYYELKLPKKDIAYVKLSWVTINGNTAIRIDGYNSWSKYAVKLDCAK